MAVLERWFRMGVLERWRVNMDSVCVASSSCSIGPRANCACRVVES